MRHHLLKFLQLTKTLAGKFQNGKKSVITLKNFSRYFTKVRQITSLKVCRLQTTDM